MSEYKTYITACMDFDTLDEKLQHFIMLRNELVMVANELGITAKNELITLVKSDPSAGTDGQTLRSL